MNLSEEVSLHISGFFHIGRKYLCLCLVFAALFLASCQENEISTNATVTTPAEKVDRTYIAVDLGEIDSLSSRFFPESRVNRLFVRLISIPLSEVVSSIRYENESVFLSLLPIKTHQGKVLSGSDILENVLSAYKEDINQFSANIIESSTESLDVKITFDREVDFQAEFYSLPLYPISYLNGEDFDSLGEYRVSSIDLIAQRIELTSDHADSIVMMHSDFEVSKTAFQSGDLDILYLPRSSSARLWADTVGGELVKIPSNQVYMLGFSQGVPFQQRAMLYMNLASQEFIKNDMGGFGEMTNFPASTRNKYDIDADVIEPMVISYICFVDSDWSYDFYRHLEKTLSAKNIQIEPVFTDFMTMMHMARAEDAEYVYAFAWHTGASTPISELLGESFSGLELNAADEGRYFNLLPVIPIASPYDYYLIQSERFRHIVETSNS